MVFIACVHLAPVPCIISLSRQLVGPRPKQRVSIDESHIDMGLETIPKADPGFGEVDLSNGSSWFQGLSHSSGPRRKRNPTETGDLLNNNIGPQTLSTDLES